MHESRTLQRPQPWSKAKGGRTIQYKITIDLETQRHLTPAKAQLLRECICDAVAFFGICFGVEFFVQRDL